MIGRSIMAAAAVGAAALAPTVGAADASGSVRISQVQIAFLVSGNVGGGTLTFKGRDYDFSIGGLGYGGFGAQKIEARGDVFNLERVEDFEGPYVQGRIGAIGDVSAQDDEAWHRALDVNVVGMARVSSVALPLLRRSDHAAIVNTCSAVAHLGVPARAVYATTKGAVLALTLAMAADHVREGIRVNAVAPGTTDTPWVERLLAATDYPAAAAEALRRRQPMGRLVTADEVAHAIAYLASPRSASTTGTILAVDGGMVSLRVATT